MMSCFFQGLFIAMMPPGSRLVRTLQAQALILIAQANCSLMYDFLLILILVLIMVISTRSLKRVQQSDKLVLREPTKKEYRQDHDEVFPQRERDRYRKRDGRHDTDGGNSELDWEGLQGAQIRTRQPNFGLDLGSEWATEQPNKLENAADYFK